MTAEEERWAEALAVDKLHGDEGAAFIAECIATLARAGDMEGVKRWDAIASRFDQLACGRGSRTKPKLQ